MIVSGVQHVSIGVTDLERAVRFYTQVLGLQQTARPDFDFAGAWFQVGAQQIHLIVRPADEMPRKMAEIQSRRPHIALRVGGYRETLAHLQALGVPYLDRPKNQTPWPQIFVVDPDGNLIELNADSLG